MFMCSSGSYWFCDDFQAGNADKWDLIPSGSTADGKFAVNAESEGANNSVLQYTAAAKGGVLALVKSASFTGVTSGDYYVEARFKPQANSTTSNKRLVLMGRYVDANNWYGILLNVQNSTGSTQVELVKMINGTLTRTIQMKQAIAMDSEWYTVRLEMIGSSVKGYFNGTPVSNATYPDGKVTYTELTAKGLTGIYTDNKSFQVDDIKAGDPSVKPVLLSIDGASTWTAEAGDAARTVNVTALKSDGTTADTYTVKSSDTSVVTVSQSGNVVTLKPVGAGSAAITFTSGSDSAVTRTITATIGAQFVMPTATYNLSGKVLPVAGDSAAYADTPLQLTFDCPPVVGTNGSIRIFKKSDDTLVDTIKLTGEIDNIGYSGQTAVRSAYSNPVRVNGNTLTINPHNSKLSYGTEYYVAISNGAVTGTINKVNFVGIGKTANWSFKTKAAGPTGTTVTVDDDGSTADFRTVQGALNYAMQNYSGTAEAPVTINVKNGTYEELLYLRGKNNVTIKGESRDGTIIQYKNYEGLNSGSGASQAPGSGTPAGGRAVLLIEQADLLTLDTLTLKNTMLRSTTVSSQAETLYFNARDTDRLIAKNAAFYSEQDTIQVKGYAWFYNTLIAGNVDFIWGANRAALFENSEIRSVGDTAKSPSGNYVLQARTVGATDPGFVFLNSKLTQGVGPGGEPLADKATYLARAAAGTWYDNIVFVNTKMDSHVNEVGWAANLFSNPNPNPAAASATSGWREYNSMDLAGNKLDTSKRSTTAKILTDAEAAPYLSRDKVFSGYNSGAGWVPTP
ncbi:hypothetical protein ACDA63_11660 [Uliginosibacterium sp. sgz301328]|uniref:hypothetical protein n=1 Tax=Uliginosibacterium sp. sgz301328 TaxID=3243764 RepID=UPI00359CD733